MQHDDRPGPDRPVSCNRCGMGVLVRKNSLAHTSVQWPADTSACTAATVAETTGLRLSCPSLGESIAGAVRRRELEVHDLDHEALATTD